MKKSAYLIGPFVGDLRWEYYYFAPYIITLAKRDPRRIFIVFTRSSRFDLYGAYSDILVPLKIANDVPEAVNKFKMNGFGMHECNMLLKAYHNKYKKRYNISKTIYPDISRFLFKVKWQFPRNEMDYNFQPRKENAKIINMFIQKHNVFVDNFNDLFDSISLDNYETIYAKELFSQVTNYIHTGKVSILGCFIEVIKTCQFVIGNLSSDYSRLALLLKKPLIVLNETLSDDSIHLINPLNTPVIRCNDIKEGMDIYENHFRSPKCGTG